MAKTTYTWDDFQRALEQSGLGGQFSQADLQNARTNPDFGMSMLAYKTDYANAATPEARALANQGAENLRSSLFGYTGGGDGGSFKLNPMSPRGFEYGEAPSFADNWADQIDGALGATRDRQPYSYAGEAPSYDSRYDPQIQETIAGILGRGEFTYDPKTDPVYSAYQKQYAREGQRATANAMGEAAAMTGGMPSSWAMTAASQAGDYYGAQMADKIPELYRDAYNRYLQEYQMKLSDLNALRGLESDDYAKYRDQLSQYNTDRQFDYATWLDQQNLTQQDLDNLRALRADDLALYQTNLGQYNANREFDYGRWLDEIENQANLRTEEMNRAETAAQYGDFSRLKAMGIDTSSAEYADLVSRGVQAAQYGDYSLLNQAGIDTSAAQFRDKLAIAADRAAVGDYSGYAELGIDTSNAELMDQLEILSKQATIDSTYANMPTEEDRALERAYQQARIASTYAGIPTEEERALDLAYRQAQISNIYAGMPTEEERALENAYKQAQIAKLLSGGSSGSSGTDGLTNSQLLTLAAAQAKRGDYSLYDALMEQYGVSTDYDAVDEASAAGMKIKSADDLAEIFDGIRQMKEEGDSRVQSQEAVKALVQGLPGYKAKTMDEVLKDFLAELFGKNAGSTAAATDANRRAKQSNVTITDT